MNRDRSSDLAAKAPVRDSAVLRRASHEPSRSSLATSAALSLANLLSTARPRLIEGFVQEFRRELACDGVPRAALIEDLPWFLADLEDRLREPSTRPSTVAARRHGEGRRRHGFELATIIREFALLRRCILALAREHEVTVLEPELEIVDRCVEDALVDVAVAYGRARDAELEVERRALDEERERLRQAVRSRDDVVAIVSHDLRNPLTAITLSTAQLRRPAMRADEGRAARLLDSIERAASRMRRLIEDLLAIAKIEAGQLHVVKTPIDLRVLLEESVEAIRPLAEDRSIEVALVPGGPAVVDCDRERILQVVENLLGNAVKFTQERRGIRVAVTSRSGVVQVAIDDDGPGIAPEAVAHVFDRFWQGTAQGLGRARPGAGLGLAIAKGIVEAHGGEMGVESVVGRGSTFWFTLPSS